MTAIEAEFEPLRGVLVKEEVRLTSGHRDSVQVPQLVGLGEDISRRVAARDVMIPL